MIFHSLKIVDIVEETRNTKTYMLECPEAFTWQEGDHTHIAHVGFNAGEAPNRAWIRHMSISTLPGEAKIGITTRVRAEGSEYKNKLRRMQIDDELIMFKLGSRMQVRRQNRPLVLLSQGVGIATFRPVILAYLQDRTDVPSVVSVNVDASGEFVFSKELDALQDSSFRNCWLNSRAAFYQTVDTLAALDTPIYYAVGSDAFLHEVIQRLRAKQVPDEDIVIDKGERSIGTFFPGTAGREASHERLHSNAMTDRV